MLENGFAWILCFMVLPMLLMALIGLLLGWLLFRRKKTVGDLSIEGEGALRAEADGLRSRVQELEGRISSRDSEVSDLKGKLAAAGAGVAMASAAAAGAVRSSGDSGSAAQGTADAASTGEADDETYALEWQNRYLAARVKYLEGRIAEAPAASAAPKAKAPAAKKAAAPKVVTTKAAAKPTSKKPAAKKPAAKKATTKSAPKPKVLYTDGPTDGAPDDLKLIKGIGPKFEKDLNGKGIYYFRQIANWKAADVKMVEGVIDSFPGRIGRDEWIKQAKVLEKDPTKVRKMATPRSTSKSSSKSSAASKASDKEAEFKKYLDNVRQYDANADESVVRGIVKYCGIALRTRDGSLVACSDETELQRVADGFVTKKLGQSSGQLELVKDICQDMKAQRFKNRVTFYYLGAQKTNKLDIFK